MRDPELAGRQALSGELPKAGASSESSNPTEASSLKVDPESDSDSDPDSAGRGPGQGCSARQSLVTTSLPSVWKSGVPEMMASYLIQKQAEQAGRGFTLRLWHFGY